MSDLEEIKGIIGLLPEGERMTVDLLATAIRAIVMSNKNGVLAMSLVGIELSSSIDDGGSDQ